MDIKTHQRHNQKLSEKIANKC